MKDVIDIGRIRYYMFVNKLTKKKFCQMCNIGLSTLNKVLNGDTNYSIVVLFKICRVMNIGIENLFVF